jgi:Tfp pilus assembly protein PilN
LIKINLVREGRAVRGAGAAPALAAAATAGAGTSLNNAIIGGCFVLGLLLGAGYWWYEHSELVKKQDEVSRKQAEAQKLEAIIKKVDDYQKQKDTLQKRIDLINQLKQNQKGPVRVMDRISQDLPDLVWLDKMTVSGGAISLSGRGLNPNAIANFVENIKNDPLFEEPELNQLTQISAAPLVYSFDMGFHFSYAPKTDTSGGATSTSGTGGTAGTSGTTGSAGTAAKK